MAGVCGFGFCSSDPKGQYSHDKKTDYLLLHGRDYYIPCDLPVTDVICPRKMIPGGSRLCKKQEGPGVSDRAY